jgi:hypothetical protein
MVWLKNFLFSITFPIRFWIEKYSDWKEERKYKKKIKEMKKKDPYIYK